MNTFSIITLVVSSSVFAALLTACVNWYLHKKNYRNEYYKKILDKRLEAYEKVNNLLQLLSNTLQLDDGRICLLELAYGKERFSLFLHEIFLTRGNSFWLSEEMKDFLCDLDSFLIHEIENHIDENKNYKTQLIDLAIENRAKISKHRLDLQQQLYKDFSSLD